MSASTPGLRSQGLSAGGAGVALRRVLPLVVFGLLPLTLCAALVLTSTGHASAFDVDFRVFWNAGSEAIHGRSPYPAAATAASLLHQVPFVYPAPAAFAMIPLSVLPLKVATVIFSLLTIAAIPAALRIVGVRDWRCYGIALLSEPVVHAVVVGAITPLLALGIALAWRYRDNRWAGAAALAAVIVLKVFLWPLLVWFALTRRFATAVAATGLIVSTTLSAWAGLGFRGLVDYPHLLQLLSQLLEGRGYSLVALGLSLGTGRSVAMALPWIAGAGLLALIALRGRAATADRWTFAAAVGACLALSPIVWLHYFILLFVPIAISRPRLGLIWALPLAYWVVGGQSTDRPVWEHTPKVKNWALAPAIGQPWLIVYAIAIALAALVLAARPRFATATAVESGIEPVDA